MKDNILILMIFHLRVLLQNKIIVIINPYLNYSKSIYTYLDKHGLINHVSLVLFSVWSLEYSGDYYKH